MSKAVLTLCLWLLPVLVCFGQASGGKVIFKANTEFSIQLESAVQTDKNNVGDDVSFVLNEDVNGDGEKVLKGSTVYARIVDIGKITAKNDTAKVCIMFDFIKKGEEFISLVAAIVSIEPNSEAIKFSASKTFSEGTVLSLKGQEIQLDKGRIFRIKLTKDVTK